MSESRDDACYTLSAKLTKNLLSFFFEKDVLVSLVVRSFSMLQKIQATGL